MPLRRSGPAEKTAKKTDDQQCTSPCGIDSFRGANRGLSVTRHLFDVGDRELVHPERPVRVPFKHFHRANAAPVM